MKNKKSENENKIKQNKTEQSTIIYNKLKQKRIKQKEKGRNKFIKKITEKQNDKNKKTFFL